MTASAATKRLDARGF
jgi:hypothetical protein